MLKKTESVNEPIAIVGLSCRFPSGANSPEEFWKLICDKYDAISEVPKDRWNLNQFYNKDARVPGTIQTQFGGFLDQFDQFDANFFGISPREAAALDPQQRLLLEVVWELFEDAGEVPKNLRGSRTGVYVGCFAMDYSLLAYSEMQRELLGMHTSVGASATILSNRISHFFDLKGPSMSIDTACSSSMVGVHLACQSLRSGETDMAVACGTNLIFKPEWTIATSKGGFLSPDGRCKVFDSSANGYVRSEGVGAVLLKPLSKALKDGNRVYAVIRETGSNQDGNTKGITVPSKDSQQSIMAAIYKKAQIAPSAVTYVEAHGTGTPTGDPIETGAIGAIFSQGRAADNPCLIGSVKSNIGHLEAASGMAGLMKATLSLYHEQIPPNIHFNNPNKNIPFADLNLRVVTEIEPFPRNGAARYVGVNSFGFGGTNVHVAMEGAESYVSGTGKDQPLSSPRLVPVSAKNATALKKSVEHLKRFCTTTDASFYDVAYNAAVRREHHNTRHGFVASSLAELQEAFDVFLDNDTENLQEAEEPSKIAFVFSGMGPQWWAMGRQLIQHNVVFQDKIKACDALLSVHADWSLWTELTADENVSRIQETQIAQPAIFAIQVALAAMLEAWGIQPKSIVGHSAGEVAAAHVSGALSLEDAILIIYHRSRLQHKTEGQGRILAVGLSAKSVEKFIKGRESDVSLGAINSAKSVALAGDEAVLKEIENELVAQEIFCKMLYGKVPYHSPKMDPLKDDLITALATLKPQKTKVPLYSTVTGELCSGPELSAEYWFKNIRNTVLFSTAIDRMIQDGSKLFVELSAHPVLSTSVREGLDDLGVTGEVIPTLRREQDEQKMLLATLAGLFSGGVSIDWQKIYPQSGNFLALPRYPWQRERYWVETEQSVQYRLGTGTIKNFSGESLHPLLGARLQTGMPLWDLDLDLDRLSYIQDHKVHDDIIYPGAGYVEAALAAAEQIADQDGQVLMLSDLQFKAALYLSPTHKSSLQLSCDVSHGDFKIFSQTEKQPWMHHASGKIIFGDLSGSSPVVNLENLSSLCTEIISVDELYQDFAGRGLYYGPSFQGIKAFSRGAQTALSQLTLPDVLDDEDYHLHPSLLDAGFQTVLGILGDDDGAGLFLPVAIESIRVFGKLPKTVMCFAELTERSADHIVGTIRLFDDAGKVLVDVAGFRCKAVGSNVTSTFGQFSDDVYTYSWEEKALESSVLKRSSPTNWIVSGGDFCDEIQTELKKQGHHSVVALHDEDFMLATEALSGEPWGLIFCKDGGALQGADLTIKQLAQLRDKNEIRLLQMLHVLNKQQKMPDVFCLVTPSLDGQEPQAASLWGMARVLINEYPNIKGKLVDLDRINSVPAFVESLQSEDKEDEISFRDGKRYVRRLTRVQEQDYKIERSRQAKTGHPYYIGRHTDAVDAFCMDTKRPAAGEVQIEAHTVVSASEDLTPDRSSEKHRSGYSGTITTIGEGVSGFKKGDEVIILAPQSCQSHLTIDARLVAHKPELLGLKDAASVPVAFVSGCYAMGHCARVQDGDTVLVFDDDHAIGLAALLVAKQNGAQVCIVTDRADMVKTYQSMGAHLALDTAAENFVETLRSATNGKGFDVILQSAVGANVARNFALLAPFGRFVDCSGSPDQHKINLNFAGSCQNISYAQVDIANLATQRPDQILELFEEILKGYVTDNFVALPSLPSCAASHIGNVTFSDKFAVDMLDPDVRPVLDQNEEFKAQGNATYMVTGGVRGFGLAAAQWLVQKGAKNLVLLGRSKTLTPESQAQIKQLQEAGVQVQTVAADVADAQAMGEIFENIKQGSSPLKGIIHAANVYGDDYLSQMSEDDFRKVYDPKALGAWNLHQCSRFVELDFFVLFSSISAVVGNPGQGNYVAGNNFFSGLAKSRKRLGLPTLVVNWGAIADVGYLARNAAVNDQLQESGIYPLDPHAALNLLGDLILKNVSDITVARMDWTKWFGGMQSSAPQRFEHFMSEPQSDEQATGEDSPLVEALKSAPMAKRPDIMEDQLLEQVGAVLGMAKSKIPNAKQGFAEMGMDSMLSVELRNRLQKSYRCKLPATLVFLYPTVEKLAAYFREDLLAEQLSVSDDPAEEATDHQGDTLEDQSIDDIAALLEQTLMS